MFVCSGLRSSSRRIDVADRLTGAPNRALGGPPAWRASAVLGFQAGETAKLKPLLGCAGYLLLNNTIGTCQDAAGSLESIWNSNCIQGPQFYR